jgi:excisionase family DNA binding protein
LTGLSRAVLREAIEAKRLKGALIGRAWRVRRADVEDYLKKLF